MTIIDCSAAALQCYKTLNLSVIGFLDGFKTKAVEHVIYPAPHTSGLHVLQIPQVQIFLKLDSTHNC